MLRKLVSFLALAAAGCSPAAEPPAAQVAAAIEAEPALAAVSTCANAEQTAKIRTFYADERPGVPLAVASRKFEVPEVIVASALPPEQSIGVDATPDITGDVWSSIESWGAAAKVSLVITPSSQHAFAFPSLVPMNQDDNTDGYLDVYADGGKGVHAHIQIEHVAKIFASDIATPEPDRRTRGISFFGPDGNLIIGVYASINRDPFDPAATAGFDRTWALLKALPRTCQS